MRQLVTNSIQKLINNQKTSKDQRTTTHIRRESHECNTLKSIKQKINLNQLIVTKADKSNTLVVIRKDDYYKKSRVYY
jgi:predicted nucleic acid binding AN1-type Zn finger protein